MGLTARRQVIYNKPFVKDYQIKFKRITADDGLSNNRVTDLIQDSYGYIWIATTNGLNRLDGSSIEVYRHNDDNFTSLNSDFILCLEESSRGKVYVGTKKGLMVFNRQANSFTPIDLSSTVMEQSTPYIRQLMFDNDSILWIETLSGFLIKYNVIANNIVEQYKHQTVNQNYYLYHTIYRDKNNTLWVGMRNQPPMYFDEIAKKFVRIETDKYDTEGKKRSDDVACYYEDGYGNFWVSALDGVYLYNIKDQTFSKFLANTTYDIKQDKLGNIWFATGSGLLEFIVKDSVIVQFNKEKDNPNSLGSNNVYKILEDKMGNLWFATDDGVSIYSKPAYEFKHYTHIPGIVDSPEGYVTTAVAEDDNSNLWIGYEDDGVDFFNRKAENFTHFLHTSNKNSLASNKVSALLYKDSMLWIGLWRGIGFNLYNINKHKFTLYTYNPNTLEKDWYGDFVIDKKNRFYIGFWGGDGLTLFDRKTGKFGEMLKNKFERVYCSRLITRMLLAGDGSIWFGTTNCGLHHYFPDADSAVSYFSDGDNDCGLESNNVIDINEDRDGNIWLINNTLQMYLPEKDSFVSFNNSSELTTNELTSLLSDNAGNIWIGTKFSGLFKFKISDNHFVKYDKYDGLGSNSFTKARLKLSNGNLFFGTTNGFNIFNPDDIVENNFIPTPYFGRLFVYDHIVRQNFTSQNTISLNSDENVFTVDLLSSDLVNPERYLYQCKLDGYDKDWVWVDNSNRVVRYASIPAGTYTLNYRIGNKNGNWSDKVEQAVLTVNKPYYLTWWFLLIVILAFAVILFLLIKQREFDLTQKYRNIELEQKLFRLQMNPHFIYNALLAIQNFIFLHDKKEAVNYLSDFAKLFRLILNNSRSEFILIDKEVETLELYLKLQQLRYPNKFTYNIFIDPDIDSELTMIPPMLAQPMIENALEHGLFYKEGKGKIVVNFIYDKDKLRFEVVDNGIGLTAAKEKNTIKENHSSAALDITKERIKILAKRHKFFATFEIEELFNENEEVSGTRVRFTLPFKKSF